MLTFQDADRLLSYDKETGLLRWRVLSGGRPAGTVAGNAGRNANGKSYVRVQCLGKTYLAHRIAFLLVTGSFPVSGVDHKDGNGTNNAWSNLRQATCIQNQRNQRLNKRNTSGHTGISETPSGWRASIGCRGQVKYLGVFRTKAEAIQARKNAEPLYAFHENHGSVRPL